MTNNNQVNWDEIPEDVEAVATFERDESSYYKVVDGRLQVQCYRSDSFDWSGYRSVERAIEYFGDRFHLRPSPITQPTPEPPESTQVETSEVDTTTTPEFDWSSVEDDVEAVVLRGLCPNKWSHWYKTVDGHVMVRYQPDGAYMESGYDSIQERVNDAISSGAEFHVRPPATTPPEYVVDYKWFRQLKERHDKVYQDICSELFDPVKLIANDKDLQQIPMNNLFIQVKDIGLNAAYDIYKKVAAEVDKIGVSSIQTETYTPKPPSISTILQEAQQSILKHHGVTGKVKFTVTYSE